MKSVIGIVGSPRRGGNTEILVDEVLKGAASMGATIKKYILNELRIGGCQGCFKCQEEEMCFQKDDMISIYSGPRLNKDKKGVLVYSQGGGNNGLEIMNNIASIFNALGIEIIEIIGGNRLNTLGAVKERESLLKQAFQAGQRLIMD